MSDRQANNKDSLLDSTDDRQVNLPYTLEQLEHDLRQLDKGNQISIPQQLCRETIDSELNQLYNFGYDVYFKNQCEHDEGGRFVRNFSRQVKMRFNCSSKQCRHFRTKWTSYYGQAFFTYKFVDVIDKNNDIQKMRYPYVLRYNLKIYKQLCRHCKEWASGQIYQSKLKTLSKMLCYISAQALQKQKDPVIRPKKQKHSKGQCSSLQGVPIDKQHKEDLCEACAEGKCKSGPRRQV